MIVRRLLAGAVLIGLAVPGIASASPLHLPWSHVPAAAPAQLPADNGARVFARADGLGQGAEHAPGALPAAVASAEQTAMARTELDAWRSGKIDRQRYVPAAKVQFTDAAVAGIATRHLKPLGAPTSFAAVAKGPYQGMTVYQFRATCATGAIDELIAWNDAGKVQFIFFRPPE